MTSHELIAAGPAGRLAGTLRLPGARGSASGGAATPSAAVLMVPGSGPMDRDNAGYFPAIRDGLVARGIAVASFDKRGVAGSAGDWRDSGPAEQAADVAAALATLRDRRELRGSSIGLFGHSQGGWVVLETAAADPGLAFVVTSSGPGVGPAEQERFALEAKRRARGAGETDIEAAVGAYDELTALVRAGASVVDLRDGVARLGLDRDVFTPSDAGELDLMRRWLDHDPRRALERLAVPLLALFGGEDRVVPVAPSIAVFAAARVGRPGGLEIALLDGADHRLRVAQPESPGDRVLHPGYTGTLVDWIRRVTR